MFKSSFYLLTMLLASGSALALTCASENDSGCISSAESAKDCSALGYSLEKVADCSHYLSCPFNTDYKVCITVGCPEGYSQGTCPTFLLAGQTCETTLVDGVSCYKISGNAIEVDPTPDDPSTLTDCCECEATAGYTWNGSKCVLRCDTYIGSYISDKNSSLYANCVSCEKDNKYNRYAFVGSNGTITSGVCNKDACNGDTSSFACRAPYCICESHAN